MRRRPSVVTVEGEGTLRNTVSLVPACPARPDPTPDPEGDRP